MKVQMSVEYRFEVETTYEPEDVVELIRQLVLGFPWEPGEEPVPISGMVVDVKWVDASG